MSEKKEYASFSEEVWDVLSKVEVDDHVDFLPKTKKRPAVSYLPWHRAWSLLKRKFPASTYYHSDDITHPDGTMEVEVNVQITRDGQQLQDTKARLAVMNNYFQAIEKPNGRDINDSRQRVLVKALAFAGLGLHLWGEDNIPVGMLDEPITELAAKQIAELIEKSGTDEAAFLKWAGVESVEEIPNERLSSARSLLEQKIKRKQREEAAA
jgi:hypothetical protein